MKIIEILTETEKEDWATLQGYNSSRMQNQFSDKKGAREFFQGVFKDELKKIAGFLKAWQRMAFSAGYPSKEAKQARNDINSILAAMDTSAAALNELHANNITLIKKKLEDAALYFGSVSHDFQDVGENDLNKISIKLHTLLTNVANEMESTIKSNVA